MSNRIYEERFVVKVAEESQVVPAKGIIEATFRGGCPSRVQFWVCTPEGVRGVGVFSGELIYFEDHQLFDSYNSPAKRTDVDDY